MAEGFVKIWLADKANVEGWWKSLQSPPRVL
jgi:hypothetical protein